MKIRDLMNRVKVLGDDNDLTQLKVGQVIKARIHKITNDTVFLDIGSNKLLKAKTTMAIPRGKYNVLRFMVKEVRAQRIIIKPLWYENKVSKETDKNISNLLNTLQKSYPLEKVELIKKMMDNRIPINEQNINKIYQLKSGYDMIEKLFKHLSVNKSKEVLEKDVIDLLKEWFRNQELDMQNQKRSPQEQIHSISQGKDTINVTTPDSQRLGEKPELINIEKMDFDQIIFLLKNKLTTNLVNATSLNNIIFKDFTITKQIQSLMEILLKNKETAGLRKNFSIFFEQFTHEMMKKNFQPEIFISNLYEKLERLKKTVENIVIDQNKEIVECIQNIKNSLDFINKLSPFQIFYQIPIVIGNSYRNLDFFICKENKHSLKINPQDVRLFLSLETKTMGIVQALIEIKNKNITCNFRIIEDEVKYLLEKFEKNLQEALIALGFQSINIYYVVSKTEENPIMGRQEDSFSEKINAIDIKV